MKPSIRIAIFLTSCLLLKLVIAQDSPDSVLPGTKQFRKSVVISGLASPWEITWGPDNMLWVTERTGKQISRVDPATGERKVAITIAEVSAPGGQDGLLGLALHPDLLKGNSNNYVYAAYTYIDERKGADPTITDPRSPYRFLYAKIVRLTYDKASGTLSKPVNIITGLPAGNDHVAGRLKFGPDRKLYFTIGDQGNNQLGNYCLPAESQRLPTRAEVNRKDYVAYVGKTLRINLDGSIPRDNPKLAETVSHVFTYGHRNPQGLNFSPDGTLYESEHGPKTDDEVNVLKAGGNYGWPNVAGFRDGKAYEYARWADATTPCSEIRFSDLAIHPSVPREPESAFTKPMVNPLATMFTVPTGYNFSDPACGGVDVVCWPTVGASGIEYYAAGSTGIPGWDKVLLVTTLKRGSLYVLPLSADGQSAAGKFSRYFQSDNRFRDTAISPDGRTIYIATDPGGMAEGANGGTTRVVRDKGAILAFTYEREGSAVAAPQLTRVSPTQPATAAQPRSSGPPPQFTAAQSTAGRTAYNANCAVCHGNTLTNGTFGPPLAGQAFQGVWAGKSARALYEASRAMPPASPRSLPDDAYTNIFAYILETNGVQAGSVPLANSETLDKSVIP